MTAARPCTLLVGLISACALPDAAKVGAASTGAEAGSASGGGAGAEASSASVSSGGGGQGGGGGGVGGGNNCVATASFPDSTPYCSTGQPPRCPPGEDGAVMGTAASYTEGDTEVIDAVTCLTWRKNASAGGLGWSAANNSCHALGNGYRLPTLLELVSVADYGRKPTWPPEFSQQQSFFWSSSGHPTGNHWGINFNEGVVSGWNDGLPGNLNARCVRGTSLGEGGQQLGTGSVVSDAKTGLEWDVASAGPFAWADAIAYCTGGSRLPSVKELLTIYAPQPPGHLPSAFTNEPSGKYWSSTPAVATNQSFAVDFSANMILEPGAYSAMRDSQFRARCVR